MGLVQQFSIPMLIIKSHFAHINTGKGLNLPVTNMSSPGPWTTVSTHYLTWDISLCYSGWDIADLDVSIYSNINRTEPILHWNNETFHTTPDIHSQLGELNSSALPEARGILRLAKKESWHPKPEDAIANSVMPFVKQFADLTTLATLQHGKSYIYNLPVTALLLPPIAPDDVELGYNRTVVSQVDYVLSSFALQTLEKRGPARMLSSLITMLSSMAYYDQMPQFSKSANTTQVYFATVLYPQSHLGYWAVMVVLAVHLGLVCCIALAFAIYSHHTLLGNHWQSIAQLLGPETEALAGKTRMATDGDVKRALVLSGHDDVRVEVRMLKDDVNVGLRVIRKRDEYFEPD
jgi:hypothetical protein